MRHIPEAGAVCGNPARTDLRGGRGVTFVPTATVYLETAKAHACSTLPWAPGARAKARRCCVLNAHFHTVHHASNSLGRRR